MHYETMPITLDYFFSVDSGDILTPEDYKAAYKIKLLFLVDSVSKFYNWPEQLDACISFIKWGYFDIRGLQSTAYKTKLLFLVDRFSTFYNWSEQLDEHISFTKWGYFDTRGLQSTPYKTKLLFFIGQSGDILTPED
ncbi:hypothetical protein KP509_14G035800 [Ceratopteris richardii]|uniref:Uncharacterized protein n=1 Tax=Ceratopteris richardii TaxID=49495 RepID=A0A8T2T743_CERRI|nr:hypothetical protein KP509_14G035800 [Ceratopteris richardii]